MYVESLCHLFYNELTRRLHFKGTYSVQFDNDVWQNSAWSNETMYQQLLFHRTFDTTNQNHFLSFVANPNGVSAGQGSWVDIDYVVFTDG